MNFSKLKKKKEAVLPKLNYHNEKSCVAKYELQQTVKKFLKIPTKNCVTKLIIELSKMQDCLILPKIYIA